MEKTKPIDLKLHGDRVAVRFYPDSHQYYASVDGGPMKRRRGVSTISNVLDKSAALQSWQKLITAEFLLNKIEAEQNIGHDEILEAVAQADLQKTEAATLGTTIHKWIEAHIKHQMGKGPAPEYPQDKQIEQGVAAFLDWEKSIDITYLDSERIVYSIKHDYIGTADLVCRINGKLAVVDFKTSNGLYNSVNAQVAGYSIAITEEEGDGNEFDEHWAIRVSKLSEKEYYEKEARKKELKDFIARKMGREPKDWPEKPYQVFEAKLLAGTKKEIKRDKDAFLTMKKLADWDKETSTFGN
jgi:hypothetical protein